MAIIKIKRGQQAAVDRLQLAEGELAVALDTGNVYIGATSGNIHINPKGGVADTAVKLQTARKISASGDAKAEGVSFDGSKDIDLNLTLSNIASLTPGTYAKVTVNAKGQVTTGETKIKVSDIDGVGAASGNIPIVQGDGKLLASLIPDLSGNYIAVGQIGKNGGVASLDSSGKVPTNQLPSFVDDVVEAANKAALPTKGEEGKIYVALDTNLTYRWGGSAYVEISPSIALGTTASTAFAGDKGQAAYEHSQMKSGNPHKTTAVEVGAAPASHAEVKASNSLLGHVKAGVGLTVTADGTLNIASIDGGTFN